MTKGAMTLPAKLTNWMERYSLSKVLGWDIHKMNEDGMKE